MPPHRPRMKRLPRIAQTDEALATYLDHSAAWLRLHAQKLYAAGFPRRDALVDGWDLNAIDAWLDRRSGILPVERIDLAVAQRSELEREFGIGEVEHSLSA
jgi:hypothetical protein